MWSVIATVLCEVCGSPRIANKIAFVTWLSLNFPQDNNIITHAEQQSLGI